MVWTHKRTNSNWTSSRFKFCANFFLNLILSHLIKRRQKYVTIFYSPPILSRLKFKRRRISITFLYKSHIWSHLNHKKNITAQFKMRNISHLFFYKSHIHITPRAGSRRQGLDSSRHYLFIPLTKYFHFFYSIYRVFFSHWYPPKKLKYGKPRLGSA